MFKQRTSTTKVCNDGCATFYRTDRFKLIWHKYVDYCEHPAEDARDNIAQATLLQPLQTSASHGSDSGYVCVANTHLLYNPKRGDLKLGQLQMLLNSLHTWLSPSSSLSSEDAKHGPSQLSDPSPQLPDDLLTRCGLLLCGDFNMTPASSLNKFVRTGRLELAGLDRRNMDGQHLHKPKNEQYKVQAALDAIRTSLEPQSQEKTSELEPKDFLPKECVTVKLPKLHALPNQDVEEAYTCPVAPVHPRDTDRVVYHPWKLQSSLPDINYFKDYVPSPSLDPVREGHNEGQDEHETVLTSIRSELQDDQEVITEQKHKFDKHASEAAQTELLAFGNGLQVGLSLFVCS